METNNLQYIKIGKEIFDWHFTVGEYSCDYADALDVTPIDKVVCAILAQTECAEMQLVKLATLLGFNAVNSPVDNLYRDESEWCIFEKFIEGLQDFGLVAISGNTIKLTPDGINTNRLGKKFIHKNKTVTLYQDEFYHDQIAHELFANIESETCNIDNEYDQGSLIKDPAAIVMMQCPELQKSNLCQLTLVSKKNRVAHISFDILYDLKSKSCKALPSNEKFLTKINNVNLDITNIEEKVLAKFFAEQSESIIYKPSFQIQMEEMWADHENEKENITKVCASSCFFENMAYMIPNYPSVVFLFVEHLDNLTLGNIEKYHNANLSRPIIVCIDYVTKEDTVERSKLFTIFREVKQLCTNDICVCTGNSYYKQEKMVIDYSGKSYCIDLCVCVNHRYYNENALIKPYLREIENVYSTYINRLLDKDSGSQLIPFFDDLEKCIIQICDKNSETTQRSLNKIEQYKNKAYNDIRSRLEGLEIRIQMGASSEEIIGALSTISSEAEKYFPDLIESHINPLRQLLTPAKPKVIKPNAFIIDTSAFINDPDILDKMDLAHDKVLLPNLVRQELDGLTHDEKNCENARKAIRRIDDKAKYYPHFIKMVYDVDMSFLPVSFDKGLKDNIMFAYAFELENSENFERIYILTDDKMFRNGAKPFLEYKDNKMIVFVRSSELGE